MYLWEYSVNNPIGKGMITISDEVLFINQKVMIGIKLPKLAVYNIEMLIGEVPECQEENANYITHIITKNAFINFFKPWCYCYK